MSPERASGLDAATILCIAEALANTQCRTEKELHRQAADIRALRESVEQLVELQRSAHPAAALEYDRFAALRARIDECCAVEEPPDDECNVLDRCRHGSHGELRQGWSAKSRARAELAEVSERHHAWDVPDRPRHDSDENLPGVPQGSLFGLLEPVAQTYPPQDFRSGGGPTPGGAQGPVSFRTWTEGGFSGAWPPDSSGAKSGDVVLMSGNLWLKLSVDGGTTFTDLDFTKIFDADTTYGGWAGDQVIHYVPAIDCFVLYVQSYRSKKSDSTQGKNVVKVALASPTDLKTHKGGKPAWRRQWNLTSDTFGLGAAWMDFPDLSPGAAFLHVNTNVFAGDSFHGKLFYELPLADMAAGRGFGFQFAEVRDSTSGAGSPIQNIDGDTNHWASHVDNSTMRIYTSVGGAATYSWRDRKVRNWPRVSSNDVVSLAPDGYDWISEDHRIIGATRVGAQVWFAWTAATGDGGGGGFSFPRAHIQIARFDIADDYRLIDQMQVWNPDYAFAYPSLMTNSDGEVGISLGYGGPSNFGSHAVGILGDFVVWYGDASDLTSLRQQVDAAGNPVTNPDGTPKLYSRWGDYVHVRLAHPDTRWFSGFGYAVNKTASGSEKLDAIYVEFGRQIPQPPTIR
ncbi:hypothetical protein OEB99_04635 [Actinotalea sp. M2MS4P-6]|uniref:hypothetical protein n=1 Tax=Actinotalea sp. M2MS4P-6 TaxID=2983762 RepID=UPI0021E4ABAF|nr:hypothetical protein [Actinotalea sp. M2MS4P-6]MCV2393587.1 hypothetical protein [Actinotalea sp. M2MS4P-6]